jgi:hypothetical protein
MHMKIKSLEDLPLTELVEIDINVLNDEDMVPAVAACHALYDLGLEDEEVAANWRKIAYRPAGRVRDFLDNVSTTRREHWQRHFTEFAKNVDERDW